MTTWKTTNTPGIRYRLHSTRKNGVNYDRYFSIRYRVDGKAKEEGLGWASEGWTEKKSAAILAELKANHTRGEGPKTLADKREQKAALDATVVAQERERQARNTPFHEIITERYLPYIQANRRNQKAVLTEMGIYKLWVGPVIGNLPLSKIAQLPHIEAIKARMKKAGKAPRTIRYALDIVRQVFNFADMEKIYQGKNPAAGRQVKRPHEDNRRNRSLSDGEGELLLSELLKHSQDVHDVSLLSLQAGLRFGEIAALRWSDVDILAGQGHLKDTKSNKNRPFFLTDDVKTMFARRRLKGAGPDQLVFPDKNGQEMEKISITFHRVVDAIFNMEVEDRRERVVFHTLRRSFATQLLNQGTSIFHIQKLLGHADITTTTRYLDTDNDKLKEAVLMLQKG